MRKTQYNNKTLYDMILEFVSAYTVKEGPLKIRVLMKGTNRPEFWMIGSENGVKKSWNIAEWLMEPIPAIQSDVRTGTLFSKYSTWELIVNDAIKTANNICITSGRTLKLVDEKE